MTTNYPIVCKLCGRDPGDYYVEWGQEWGSVDIGPNDARQRPALFVYCQECYENTRDD